MCYTQFGSQTRFEANFQAKLKLAAPAAGLCFLEVIMIYMLNPDAPVRVVTVLSVIFAFVCTFLTIRHGMQYLPKDGGRAFAINGTKSVGKPRGAGIIIWIVFTIAAFIFLPMSVEMAVYLALAFVEMLSGYFDDASEKPWSRLKKGLLDFAVAAGSAVNFLYFNDNSFYIAYTNTKVTLHPVIYGILIVVLIWAAINVTNCSDGVDGLCTTLSCVTLVSVYLLMRSFGYDPAYRHMLMVLIVCLLAYLWFNTSPSQILMGDAGSRAIGIMIAYAFLKLYHPLLFIPLALILILDGGLGLIKVTCIKVFHKNPMKNLRTPIHDHFRKNKEWSDPQVVSRLVIVQVVIAVAVLYTVF